MDRPVEKPAIAMEGALSAIETLREKGAVVHCITNTVAQNFTANVLLACGATPTMTVARDEAGFFTSAADAVLVNLGTLDDDRHAAIRQAVLLASRNSIPLVLDPVMCHVSPPRLALAREIVAARPVIIRANAGEYEALGDAVHPDTVVARTGAVDEVTTGKSTIKIANGHGYLGRIIATGCAQGALMAALASVAANPVDAAIAALLWFGVAGELAAENASGPGTFQPLFLDALCSVSTGTIAAAARVQ